MKWWEKNRKDDDLTWRDLRNVVLTLFVSVAIVLVYGYWPRHREAPAEAPAENVVTNLPDYFADNFDPVVEGLDPMDDVIDHLIEVENPGRDPHLVGDKHLTNKAHGLLQIRKPYLDDANRIAGTSAVKRVWGKPKLTMKDMKDEAKARWAAKVVLKHYGREYTKLTGKRPTLEVYGRIHNGGPDGWAQSSTNEYARRLREK